MATSKVEEGEPLVIAGYGEDNAVWALRLISRKEFTGYGDYLLDEAIYTAPALAFL